MSTSRAWRRREAYNKEASVGDQLDAIWKFINQQRLIGVDLPQETDDMLNKILAVKKKIKK